jgi:2,4-dienoyl-CoA reductase-like NADH-dependent reductase (Old Yellow Enzyme family)
MEEPSTLPLLLSPSKLRGVTSKNRIIASPMCQYRSTDGSPSDWQMAHLGRLAIGGAGIIFGEETAIEARGRKTYECAGIWNDQHIAHYRRLTDLIRSCDALPAIQLGHAGRKAACHGATQDWAPLTAEDAKDDLAPWQGLAPSAVQHVPRFYTPRAMDRDDIHAALKTWHEATLRSVDAGYEVIEIHGAHGYLIHQFLSPASNLRDDAYGGDLNGRMRFALEVTEVVRAAWPANLPLFFRVSAVDGKGGSWELSDTVALARELKDRGVDVVDCSSGGIYGDSDLPMIPRTPEFQVTFAATVRRQADVATVAVGGITDPMQAEQILRHGDADFVALARELLWYADWPSHANKTLNSATPYGQIPYEYSYRLQQRDAQKEMAINQRSEVARAAYRRVFDADPNW